MSLQRLLPTSLIVAAFVLGAVTASAFILLVDEHWNGVVAVVPLLLGLGGLGFGLVGLSAGFGVLTKEQRRASRAGRSRYQGEDVEMTQGTKWSPGLEVAARQQETAVPQSNLEGRVNSTQSSSTSQRSQSTFDSGSRKVSRERGRSFEPDGELPGPSTNEGLQEKVSRTGPRDHLTGSDRERREAAVGRSELEMSRPVIDEAFFDPPSEQPALRSIDLIQVWEEYESEGDGHFTPSGFSRRLASAGIDARALAGEELGVGDAVLAVEPLRGGSEIYLLPDFNRPASAVVQWFENQGSGVRTAYIKRLIQVAEAERRGGELVIRRKGIVA